MKIKLDWNYWVGLVLIVIALNIYPHHDALSDPKLWFACLFAGSGITVLRRHDNN